MVSAAVVNEMVLAHKASYFAEYVFNIMNQPQQAVYDQNVASLCDGLDDNDKARAVRNIRRAAAAVPPPVEYPFIHEEKEYPEEGRKRSLYGLFTTKGMRWWFFLNKMERKMLRLTPGQFCALRVALGAYRLPTPTPANANANAAGAVCCTC